MPDRVIRDELLDSERWLALPCDTDRLVFVGLLLRCDDFGNLEGGPRRLFRFLHGFTQVKTEEAAGTALMHLADADMLRRYEIEKREYFHLPRFKAHRQYIVRKYPPSPWDIAVELGKTQRVQIRGLAKDHQLSENVASTSLPRSMHVAQGVGVGVELRTTKKSTSNPQPVDNSPHVTFVQHWTAKAKTVGIEAKPGEQPGDFAKRVQQFFKERSR